MAKMVQRKIEYEVMGREASRDVGLLRIYYLGSIQPPYNWSRLDRRFPLSLGKLGRRRRQNRVAALRRLLALLFSALSCGYDP